jgi:hypothetical protein
MSVQWHNVIDGVLLADQLQYKAGYAVESTTHYYSTDIGRVGIVTSSYANAAVMSATDNNEWYTVGVLCHRDTVWVYNPAYVPLSAGAGAGVPEPQRLPMVPGMSNVTCLFDSTGFDTVNSLYIQGPDVLV